MHYRFFSTMTRGLAAFALVSLFASSFALRAQEPATAAAQSSVTASEQDSHLVSSMQLDQQVKTASDVRQKEIRNLTEFLSTSQAEKAMKDAKIDPVQVRTAIPSLSDAELADLSARADHAQHGFAAGVSNQTLLIIILVIVAVILIAVIH